jgi:hypothetical protein
MESLEQDVNSDVLENDGKVYFGILDLGWGLIDIETVRHVSYKIPGSA